MGRKIDLTVEGEAPLRDGQWYAVQVTKVEALKRKKCVEITLRHGKGEHEGRLHLVQLALPIRPFGFAAEFFRACGFEVSQETTIRPSEVVGKALEVSFRMDLEGLAEVAALRKGSREKRP